MHHFYGGIMAYINKNDFSIVSVNGDPTTMNDYFECDDIIAPAISLLNRKGYKTIFCCSGHPFSSISAEVREEFPSKDDMESPEFKILWFDDSDCAPKELDFNTEEYPCYVICQYNFFDTFYVAFEQMHEFPELPDGFYIDDGNIYYDSQRLPLSTESFEGITKIYEINKAFYEWVEKLPSLKGE